LWQEIALASSGCYLATFCNLHVLQVGLSHGFEATFGVGRIGLRTLLQLVHSFLDLQNCLTHKEQHAMWDLANELDADYGGLLPNSIKKAVLTCWCSVTAAARAALKHWKQWRKFAQDIANATRANTKTGKIAQDLIVLMFIKHFKWL
jgi:hypothetical protein